jgi:glycine/D-amino acid oxidase-like deaminating enzyme/nitrite reductase/ring-hydroxylating ferredoxin subunit
VKPRSLWIETAPSSRFPKLKGDRRADVVIVGAGITGVTAAVALRRAGMNVIAIDSGYLGGGETGFTTAHLTLVLDMRFRTLLSRFGERQARLVVESQREAIAHIAVNVREERIECGFSRVPGFLYSESKKEIASLRQELDSAWRLGIPASLIENEPVLPFRIAGAIRFEDQARFHPLLYLRGLARQLRGSLFQQTRAIGIEEGRIHTENGSIKAPAVVVAANVPVCNRVLLHTKLAAYRTYAVAARIPRAVTPRALYWDTADPYHYLRSHNGWTIIGGEDHKTGEDSDSEARFERLERYARDRFPVRSIPYRWSGQIINPVDGLPYIGRNAFSKNMYVATGFMGNGMTFGTLAGMIIADQILGRSNPYGDVFAATRVKPLASAKKFVAENVGFPAHWIADRISRAEGDSLQEIQKGEGKIVNVDGEKTAVYRDESGKLIACSPVCPHLGCHVRWNDAERTWDCPCHGSRFDPKGEVINGPATQPLQRRKLNPKS